MILVGLKPGPHCYATEGQPQLRQNCEKSVSLALFAKTHLAVNAELFYLIMAVIWL